MVNRFGYVGVLILIAVENVFPPIPSEVILTFGGFLTTCTRLHPAGVVLSSTAGSLLGALVLYGAGTLVSPESLSELLDSRPMKLLGFHAEDAWKTITWFQKKGQRAVLFGRCIPIIRSLISVPAGMARSFIFASTCTWYFCVAHILFFKVDSVFLIFLFLFHPRQTRSISLP